MNFEQRFVAFIDILGFREMVKDQTEVARVMDIINSAITVAKTAPESHRIFPKDEIRLTALSDSIVLSLLVGNDKYDAFKSLRFLLSAVEKIQYRCALADVWMRGGVSWGPLHHEGNGSNVVGDGLVRAYEIELSAGYPRVLLDPSMIPKLFVPWRGPSTRQELIVEINKTYDVAFYSGKFLFDRTKLNGGGFSGYFQDDAPLFIHYFHSVYETATPETDRKALVEALKKRLYASKSPEVYAKYRWVVDYLTTLAPTGAEEAKEGFYAELQKL